MSGSSKQSDKAAKRANALRDNLKKRKALAKAKSDDSKKNKPLGTKDS